MAEQGLAAPLPRQRSASETRALVEELPFTYVHVFPFSPREGTVAAELRHGRLRLDGAELAIDLPSTIS